MIDEERDSEFEQNTVSGKPQPGSPEADRFLLARDKWQNQKGHIFTYWGLFCFTLTLYFRPYELIPAFAGFTSLALIIAIATLVIYLPSQLTLELSPTAFPVEVKCVLFLCAWALLTIPLAKDPGEAWSRINETFIKVVIIFVVMVNALRTPARLKGLMWLSIGAGVMLSYQAINLYQQGKFEVEGYRVKVDLGGMFGNPNDLAIHLAIFAPICVGLALASGGKITKLLYFAAAAVMAGGIMVTQSRGGFLGLFFALIILALKVGRRKNRLKVLMISGIIVVLVIALAPGHFGTRILSIFDSSLDPVGSSVSRFELLKRSILVTMRNPLGIGFGNFPIVSSHNQETHNAYTQVSSELGWLAAVVYVIFLISPLKRLAAVERLTADKREDKWLHFTSIGVYAGIVAYMVSSFFGPVAYNWFVYYPVAYAICLRRLYQKSEVGKQTVQQDKHSEIDLQVEGQPLPAGY